MNSHDEARVRPRGLAVHVSDPNGPAIVTKVHDFKDFLLITYIRLSNILNVNALHLVLVDLQISLLRVQQVFHLLHVYLHH